MRPKKRELHGLPHMGIAWTATHGNCMDCHTWELHGLPHMGILFVLLYNVQFDDNGSVSNTLL